jgi:hypothetical protein
MAFLNFELRGRQPQIATLWYLLLFMQPMDNCQAFLYITKKAGPAKPTLLTSFVTVFPEAILKIVDYVQGPR